MQPKRRKGCVSYDARIASNARDWQSWGGPGAEGEWVNERGRKKAKARGYLAHALSRQNICALCLPPIRRKYLSSKVENAPPRPVNGDGDGCTQPSAFSPPNSCTLALPASQHHCAALIPPPSNFLHAVHVNTWEGDLRRRGFPPLPRRRYRASRQGSEQVCEHACKRVST
jgi:hypothetical protein